MEDIGLVATAYHEAGHVAVAHALDCRVDGMEVFWSDLGRWFGRSPTKLTKEDLDGFQLLMRMAALSAKGAKIAIAGMLAQARFLAALQLGEQIRFDTDADLGDLVKFLRNNMRTEDSPGSTVIAFELGAGGESHRIEQHGFIFSTEDSNAFNYYLAKGGDTAPELLAVDTMRMLNDDSVWIQVRELAEMLLRQPAVGDDKRQSLTAGQLLEVLSQ